MHISYELCTTLISYVNSLHTSHVSYVHSLLVMHTPCQLQAPHISCVHSLSVMYTSYQLCAPLISYTPLISYIHPLHDSDWLKLPTVILIWPKLQILYYYLWSSKFKRFMLKITRSLCFCFNSKLFPVLVVNSLYKNIFLANSLCSGKMDFQIPCFPCAVAPLFLGGLSLHLNHLIA